MSRDGTVTLKQRIAIVEDEMSIADMYTFKLSQSGYDVRCAYDGKAGLELIESFRPELILLDLMMPEMTGQEVLKKVRATDWGGAIKVIILTNISKDEAPSPLRFLNVDRYIVKAHYTPSQVLKIAVEVLATGKPEK
jgi:DNA-binding response OmpR family regulator